MWIAKSKALLWRIHIFCNSETLNIAKANNLHWIEVRLFIIFIPCRVIECVSVMGYLPQPLSWFQLQDTDTYNHCFSCVSPILIKNCLKLHLYLFSCPNPQYLLYFIELIPKVETWYLPLLPTSYAFSGYPAHTPDFSLYNNCLHTCVTSETELPTKQR